MISQVEDACADTRNCSKDVALRDHTSGRKNARLRDACLPSTLRDVLKAATGKELKQSMSLDVELFGSPHVSVERSAAFLLEDTPLELWEHKHLFRCSE
jgi:hypothetical protein